MKPAGRFGDGLAAETSFLISQRSWNKGCLLTLGCAGAAVCLLRVNLVMQREVDPVRQPGAYFRAMSHQAGPGTSTCTTRFSDS